MGERVERVRRRPPRLPDTATPSRPPPSALSALPRGPPAATRAPAVPLGPAQTLRPHPLRSVYSAPARVSSSQVSTPKPVKAVTPALAPARSVRPIQVASHDAAPSPAGNPYTPRIRTPPPPSSTIRRLRTVFEETPAHLRALEGGWRETRRRLGVEVAEIVRVAGERRERERESERERERNERRERERSEKRTAERERERRDWAKERKVRGRDTQDTNTNRTKPTNHTRNDAARPPTRETKPDTNPDSNRSSPLKPARRLAADRLEEPSDPNRTIRWKDPVSVSYSASGLPTPPSSPAPELPEPEPETPCPRAKATAKESAGASGASPPLLQSAPVAPIGKSAQAITARPLPPTTSTLKSGHTITVHPPTASTALTISYASVVATVNRAGDEVRVGRLVLRLGALDEAGRKIWMRLSDAVTALKRITPHIKVYTPLGDVVLTCCAPPDVVLTFTMRPAGEERGETKVRIRYSLLCAEYVLDTATRAGASGESFKSRRAGRIDAIAAAPEGWGAAEAEGVRRLWAVRDEWEGYVK